MVGTAANGLILILLALLFVGGVIITLLWLMRMRSGPAAPSGEELASLQQALSSRLDNLTQHTYDSLQQFSRNITDNLQQASRSYCDLAQQMTEMKTASSRVVELSQGVKQLNTILSAPKLRGIMGEFSLQQMLAEMVPAENYAMPYNLKNNMVDAAIVLKEGILGIDSKFPLENFRKALESEDDDARKSALKTFYQDIKKHIDAIHGKYIIPELTLDFAVMFIPAENVYYEMLLNTELHKYALEQRVIPASPNTLYAYLSALSIGFRGMKIEAKTRAIEQSLLNLKVNFDAFKEHFAVMGKHLGNLQKQWSDAEKDLNSFELTLNHLKFGSAPDRED